MVLKSSWGIVATVDEPLPLLAAFVAHHRALGAAQIYLYLDRDAPDVEALFAQDSAVILTRTDAAYWSAKGEYPQVHVRRQLFNAMDAYDQARVDWLLHCDGDEFLHLSDALEAELAALPDSVVSLTIQNSERVWLAGQDRPSIFAGAERHPVRRATGGLPDVFGASFKYLNQGLLGYPNGKPFARTWHHLYLGIHATKHRGSDGWADHEQKVKSWESTSTRLVYFDGLTPLHWKVKLLRKVRDAHSEAVLKTRLNERRFAQIEAIRQCSGDVETLTTLHG
ncbi:glycosyltransferase family 2 protein [Flavimaricola marinus]|uniref:Glycosyl transferase family 2 n=1 Tax=Flavimaricola marinus TaxID=1819565 RepID=A0A238L8Q1_9RHOB|nr:glycosyltransferase family 2 protein [Flavimaricola marinus]SMY06077.1 hypothetical protein LOM8899_00198 [Flavimaricola marinus]